MSTAVLFLHQNTLFSIMCLYGYILYCLIQAKEQNIKQSIILQVHSTCFGCQPHPSQEAHKTVTKASGTGYNFCAATSLQRGQASLATLEGGSCQRGQTNLAMLEGGSCQRGQTNLAMLEGGSCQRGQTNLAMLEGGSCQRGQTNLAMLEGGSCQRGQTNLGMLERGSCTKNMTSTGGYSYSFVYS